LIERLFQARHQVVAGLERAQGFFPEAEASARQAAPLGGPVITQGVVRQRPEPPAEAARRVVDEVLHRPGRLEEDHLGHFLGLGVAGRFPSSGKIPGFPSVLLVAPHAGAWLWLRTGFSSQRRSEDLVWCVLAIGGCLARGWAPRLARKAQARPQQSLP